MDKITKIPQINVAESLQEKANKDDVFNAICYVFAKRQRARRQVTVAALKQAMEHEGADFSINQYRAALEYLGALDLGKLRYNTRKQVVALTDIKYTLQSIGQVAAAKAPDFKKIGKPKETMKFSDLSKAEPIEASRVISLDPDYNRIKTAVHKATEVLKKSQHEGYEVLLTIIVGDSPMAFGATNRIKPGSLGEFLSNFKTLTKTYE